MNAALLFKRQPTNLRTGALVTQAFCARLYITSILIAVVLLQPAVVLAASTKCNSDEGYLHERLCDAWEEKLANGVVHPVAAAQIGSSARVREFVGDYGMGAQFTPHRAAKRALNQPLLKSTRLAFNASGFHFGKVRREEVLLCFNPEREGPCQHTAAKNTCHMPRYVSAWPGDSEKCGPSSTEPAVIIVNVNPVCHGQSLLVPDIAKGQPQFMSEEALSLALAFAMRASPQAWLSFNSIGAGASVNHLHWQIFYGDVIPTGRFPLHAHMEASGGLAMAAESRGPVSLDFTPAWPLCAWVFTWTDATVLQLDTHPAELRLSEFVYSFVERLQELDIAHNILICCGGTRVLVVPRRVLNQQGMDVSNLQVAGHEVLGWWIVPRESDFLALDDAYAASLLREAALSEDMLGRVVDSLQKIGWRLSAAASRAARPTMAGAEQREL